MKALPTPVADHQGAATPPGRATLTCMPLALYRRAQMDFNAPSKRIERERNIMNEGATEIKTKKTEKARERESRRKDRGTLEGGGRREESKVQWRSREHISVFRRSINDE